MGLLNDEFPENPLLTYEAETEDTRAAIRCALEFLRARREEVRRMAEEAKNVFETNLGADQIGELFTAVQPFLVEGETFLVREEEPMFEFEDEYILHIIGSRGTCLVAQMTDRGWTISADFEEVKE